MTPLSAPDIRALVHRALAARVSALLSQSSFEELMATQTQVADRLAEGAWPRHGREWGDGVEALARSVVDALGLDPVYYGGSSLEFILSEGLSSAGVALAEAVRGHERDSRSRWQAQVVPRLDQVADLVASVVDGTWARSPHRRTLAQLQADFA